MTNSKTIDDVMAPLRVFNWIVGCGGIIEYPLNNPHMVISLIYSSAWALNYCLLTYLCVYYNNKISSENLENSNVTSNDIFYIFFFYGYILVTFATIVMGWRRGKEVKIGIKNIEKIDKLLRILRISDEYDKMYMKQIYLLAFTVTILTILITMSWFNTLFRYGSCTYIIKIIFAVKYNYPIAILFINDFTFISFISCLKRKFEQLNDLLKTMSGASPFYPQYIKIIYAKTGIHETQSNKLRQKTNDDIQIIKAAKQAHLDLVKICKRINNNFGLHLLISMTLASLWIIYNSYTAYTVYIYSQNENKNKQIISSFNYLVFGIIKILAVNHVCDTTSLEALKTGSIICELHEPTTSEEFRSEIREFTLQLIQNPLKFTVFGFVTLNHSFIQDVVGTITTYLVILIQLRDMTESK